MFWRRRRETVKPMSLAKRANTHLPADHHIAHEACFAMHDVITHLIVAGERDAIFSHSFELRDEEERTALEATGDVFEWLAVSGRVDDQTKLLVNTIFPAILSDMLHCIYEALETSRKGKLTVSYLLLRKPLQESLFVLESFVMDRLGFAEKLRTDPGKLSPRKAGGIEAHTKRIEKVLSTIGEVDRFDALYIAKLRYAKGEPDSFAGIFDKSTHLFTNHEAIRTEPLNVNMIFSGESGIEMQWEYLYSRLPYLMAYIGCLVEHICAGIAASDPQYVLDVERRTSALILLASEKIAEQFLSAPLLNFLARTLDRLTQECKEAGYEAPSREELVRMAETGAYPGESRSDVKRRVRSYALR